MIKKSNGSIGTRELVSIILMTIGIKISDMTPSLLIKTGKNATWVIPIISGLIIMIPFMFLLSLLKEYRNKGLIDIIYTLTGKYFGFLITFTLFIMTLFATFTNGRNYADIMHTMFLPRTPVYIILITLFFSGYLMANRGFESLGRGAWFVIPAIKIVIFILAIISFSEIDFGFLYPLGGPGNLEILKSSVVHSSILSEIIIITVLFSFIRDYKTFKKASLIGLWISVFELSLFYFIYIGVFDYPTVSEIAFPFQQLSSFIDIGQYFRNLTSFFFGFWVMGAVFRFGIYLYVLSYIFAHSLKINEFEPLILPFTGLSVLLGLIPENSIDTIFFLRNILLNKSWIVIIFLPITLWIIDKLKNKRPKSKTRDCG